jgi:AcrR family transcriptional regulator
MAKATRPPQARRGAARRTRGSLSREEILAGARALIQQQGLTELSMPRLARQLHSGVTSIYWYFRSKDDLLFALAEQVSKDLYARLPPVSNGPWDRELESYFVAFREQARRLPVYLELFGHRGRLLVSRQTIAEPIVRRLEDEISVLVRAGLSPEDAAHAYAVCSAFTRGFVLLESAHETELREGVDEDIDRTIASLPPSSFPTLTRLASFGGSMRLRDSHFRSGLSLVIDGLRNAFPALRRSAARSRARVAPKKRRRGPAR